MSLRRDIGKRSVAIIAKKIIVRMNARRLKLPRGSVYEENVLIPIVVVIQKARAGPIDIHEVDGGLVPIEDLHVQAGLLGDVGEDRQGRSTRTLVGRIYDGPKHCQEDKRHREQAGTTDPKFLGRDTLHRRLS